MKNTLLTLLLMFLSIPVTAQEIDAFSIISNILIEDSELSDENINRINIVSNSLSVNQYSTIYDAHYISKKNRNKAIWLNVISPISVGSFILGDNKGQMISMGGELSALSIAIMTYALYNSEWNRIYDEYGDENGELTYAGKEEIFDLNNTYSVPLYGALIVYGCFKIYSYFRPYLYTKNYNNRLEYALSPEIDLKTTSNGELYSIGVELRISQ